MAPGIGRDNRDYVRAWILCARRDVGIGDLAHAEILLREKKIGAIPDWCRAPWPNFVEQARTATLRYGVVAVLCVASRV
jgi:hypothetical protein